MSRPSTAVRAESPVPFGPKPRSPVLTRSTSIPVPHSFGGKYEYPSSKKTTTKNNCTLSAADIYGIVADINETPAVECAAEAEIEALNGIAAQAKLEIDTLNALVPPPFVRASELVARPPSPKKARVASLAAEESDEDMTDIEIEPPVLPPLGPTGEAFIEVMKKARARAKKAYEGEKKAGMYEVGGGSGYDTLMGDYYTPKKQYQKFTKKVPTGSYGTMKRVPRHFVMDPHHPGQWIDPKKVCPPAPKLRPVPRDLSKIDVIDLTKSDSKIVKEITGEIIDLTGDTPARVTKQHGDVQVEIDGVKMSMNDVFGHD